MNIAQTEEHGMADVNGFDTDQRDGVTIVRLGPEFASVYEGELKELAGILDLADSTEPPRLVIDLSGTQYFGSAFIGFLIAVATRMSSRPSGRFSIAGASDFARIALATTRSDQLIEIFDTVDAAVAANA